MNENAMNLKNPSRTKKEKQSRLFFCIGLRRSPSNLRKGWSGKENGKREREERETEGWAAVCWPRVIGDGDGYSLVMGNYNGLGRKREARDRKGEQRKKRESRLSRFRGKINFN